ncbi:dynamin family protein, partial [Jannaschia sp.]|nr:dynamin family protein [Jannaschia sp.]
MLDDVQDRALLPGQTLGQGARLAREAAETRHAIGQLLDEAATLVVPEAVPRIDALRAAHAAFRARVSLIGQVKAGKTALTNALIAQAGLLPSDVNPWTSVVTSIHLNTQRPKGKSAVFTFFSSQDWADMVERGGALGRTISEADAGLDLEEGTLRDQIAEMQRRTEKRLGRNFALLLDGSHSFSVHSATLVERYVCMGDIELDQAAAEGRYADVTRSADLYHDHPDFALPTTLSDTPGVNDPFLVREAATLERIGETDLCVLVLNANQALSTVDVGLMRVLRGMQGGQVVLFVNRVDQLSDADRQIPRIEAALRALLRDQGLDPDVAIVFGSALWAEQARFGAEAEVPPRVLEALATLSQARETRAGAANAAPSTPGSAAWIANRETDLSGLHELVDLIQDRSARDVARPALAETAREAGETMTQSALLLSRSLTRTGPALHPDLDRAALTARIDILRSCADTACREALDRISERMQMLISGTYFEFTDRESKALTAQIRAGGDPARWEPDAERLRQELGEAHDALVAMAPAEFGPIFRAAAERVAALYGAALQDGMKDLSAVPPTPARPGAPTALMKTMIVDLSGSLLGSWLRRKL